MCPSRERACAREPRRRMCGVADQRSEFASSDTGQCRRRETSILRSARARRISDEPLLDTPERALDMSPPDDGPGLLVQCGFGNEERAVGEVRAALGSTATTRGAVSHKGLGWLALDDAAAADATSAFAALVGAPTPACPTPPDPAVLRNCQALFPCLARAPPTPRPCARRPAPRRRAPSTSGAVPALARPTRASPSPSTSAATTPTPPATTARHPSRARTSCRRPRGTRGRARRRHPPASRRTPPRPRRRRPRRAVAQTVPRLRRRREPRRGRVRAPTGRERPDVRHRHPPEDAVRRPLEGYLPREDFHQSETRRRRRLRRTRRRATPRTRGRPPTGCRPTGCRARCRAIGFRSGRARGPRRAREVAPIGPRARGEDGEDVDVGGARARFQKRFQNAAADGPRRRRRRARRRDRAKTRRGTPPAGTRDVSERG